MLIEYIERMRREPPAVRRRAVATWTTLIVVLIGALYLMYIGLHITVFTPKSDILNSTIAAPYESGQ